ncbi:hypothetical protein AWV79_30225 [Cupriavidus sp. UYMMa02A]|nr:hypothetical protein AWV79_30225 [Cupriavidus sp. UYMMa02A]
MPHVFTSLVALSVATFAAAPTEAQHLTLVGEIHIKANEPFPKVILETAAHKGWELEGVSLNEARLVSRRQITALRRNQIAGPGCVVAFSASRELSTNGSAMMTFMPVLFLVSPFTDLPW